MISLETLVILNVSLTSLSAEPKPLFHSGSESFFLIDTKSKHPTFRVLGSTTTKQSIALAINSQDSIASKKSPLDRYVELKFEKVTLQPQKNQPDKIDLHAQISGHEYKLDQPLSRASLISGRTLDIKIPAQKSELPLFTVISKGSFKIRFDRKQNVLWIDQANAEVSFDSSIMPEAPEKIQFKAKGLRQ